MSITSYDIWTLVIFFQCKKVEALFSFYFEKALILLCNYGLIPTVTLNGIIWGEFKLMHDMKNDDWLCLEFG